jgi:Tol biopolymer transport system component
MRGLIVRSIAVLVACAAAVLAPWSARALHRETPFMLTISCRSTADPIGTCVPNTDASHPFAQGEVARWIGFESTTDIMGNGSSGSEIFLFDNNPPRNMRQVTNHPTGDSRNASTVSNGSTMVFDSSSDLRNNGITARQIFMWDRESGQYTQLTNGTADSVRPRISGSGNLVAFESAADLVGDGTTGTNIYYWQPSQICDFNGCRYIRRVTSGPGISGNVVTGGGDNGQLLLFNSNSPVTGFSNGFQQIFMYERGTNRRIQLTAFGADSIKPTMNNDGRLIVFQSQADVLGNGSTGWEIFLLDRETGIFRQLTNTGGDSFNASMGGGGRYITFISTGDVVGNGSTGQHLFLYDLIWNEVYQVTKGAGSSDNPVSTADTIFFFDSSADPLKLGLTGNHVYALNVFNTLPRRSPGTQEFDFQPGNGTSGSEVRLTTRDGVYTAPIGEGGMDIRITGQDFDGEGGVSVPMDSISIPPVPVPSFGAVCFEPTGSGIGSIDCNGGKQDLDVLALQDHDLDETEDPFCLLGCRENDASCQGPLIGPHFDSCPKCLLGICNGGLNAGLACQTNTGCPLGECISRVCDSGIHVDEACTADTDCVIEGTCEDGQIPVCNGPVSTSVDGVYTAGAMNIAIPLTAKISIEPGLDNQFCTGDDTYRLSGIEATLRLTTGTTTAGITDADNLPGVAIGASETGAPFNCDKLQEKDVTGARLVGAVPFLDVPAIPGLRDVILTWRFQAAFGPPCTANCPQPCTVDAECNDGNLCNGNETCVANNCQPGIPKNCNDGNACNGVETCAPATGECGTGPAPVCNDNNPCTDDACDFFFGCRHDFNEAPCNDGNACSSADACFLGQCQGTLTAAAIACNQGDGDYCNGAESCNVLTGACDPGTPLVCNDNNDCTDDACYPLVGCAYQADDSNTCTDNDACTTDLCNTGTCVSTAVACSDNDPCNGLEACNPGTGLCDPGVALVCDDNNTCTSDACTPGVGCEFTAIAGPCDDGNACSSADSCFLGQCQGTLTPGAVTCNAGDGDPCNGAEACDPGTGACLPGPAPTCDDNNSCTDDSCVPFVGCVGTPNDLNPCTDNDTCTTDVCSAGVCVATPVACSNGDACDGLESCNPGTGLCDPGVPLVCDDFVACTQDFCDPLSGCGIGLPAGIEGIICILDQMRTVLLESQFGTVAPKLKRRLNRSIDRTQNLYRAALSTSVQKEQDLLRAGNKRLVRFLRLVERGLGKDKIVASVANPLIDLARSARDATQALIVP